MAPPKYAYTPVKKKPSESTWTPPSDLSEAEKAWAESGVYSAPMLPDGRTSMVTPSVAVPSPYSMFDLGAGRAANRMYWQNKAENESIQARAAKRAQKDAEKNDALTTLIDELLSGSSGGGGGGMSELQRRQLEGVQTLADAIGQQLAGGSYKDPYQELGKRLAKTYKGAAKKIRKTYGNLEEQLSQATNPYQNFTAESGVEQPGLMDYLAQMGGDTSGLSAEVMGGREAAAQQAAAFQNIANMMAQQTALANTGRLGDVQAGRAAQIADLLGQRAAYQAAIQQQEQQKRESLFQLLAQLATQGADVGRYL